MHFATSFLVATAAQAVYAQNHLTNHEVTASGQVILDETPRANLKFPPSRGSNSLVSGVSPCQGYELAGRIEFPISGGSISWEMLVDVEDTRILYSTSEDPSSQDDFEEALTNVTDRWRGQQCVDAPNFAALGLSVGQNITLQFTNKAGPRASELFECADLTLVSQDDFEDLNFETSCINEFLTTQLRRDTAANPALGALREEAEAEALADAESQASDSSDSNGLTLVQAGVIGAMVTLGVMVLCLAFAWWAGVAAFGKRATSDFPQKHPSISSGSPSKV